MKTFYLQIDQEKDEDCLTQKEFISIQFKAGLPYIIGDLILYITGKPYSLDQEKDHE